MNTVEKNIIRNEILDKWQIKIDLLMEMLHVSAALIMKVHPNELEVFVRSNNEENPFLQGEKGELHIGSYCELVVQNKLQLEVSDAEKDELWKDNLTCNKKMKSYLGLPVLFPNQDLFGTLCVMNQEARSFSDLDRKLVDHFRGSIEDDLVIEEQNEIIRNTPIY